MADNINLGDVDRLTWSRRLSLTARILFVNIIALVLLAGSLFYLDSYRKRLLTERFSLVIAEARMAAEALNIGNRTERRAFIIRAASTPGLRLRLFDQDGALESDSFALAPPSYSFADPDSQSLLEKAAHMLDRATDTILGTPAVPAYVEPRLAAVASWPEAIEARATQTHALRYRHAPDRTPVITAAVPVGRDGAVLLSTRSAPDVTQAVRDARQTLANIIGAALIVSIMLSLFLARTIVKPLRLLVRAAVRVRLGRDRAVVVPRLPERRDEIGMLARAISDMTSALRHRIDAVESFAADVTHEIKNPLASLRSALESLEKVSDPALRRQLTDIATHDVRRIDRLVSEVSEASRIDAELSRTAFEPVNVGKLVRGIIDARDRREPNANNPIKLTLSNAEPLLISGEPAKLTRVFDNLIDNAISFSPPGKSIELSISAQVDRIIIATSDHGPGIPEDLREQVFERFHSARPPSEDFGSHSGLGLAIARTIIASHDGTLVAADRADGKPGACLVIDLPAWQQPE